jgi:hypothetical protein
MKERKLRNRENSIRMEAWIFGLSKEREIVVEPVPKAEVCRSGVPFLGWSDSVPEKGGGWRLRKDPAKTGRRLEFSGPRRAWHSRC